MQISSAKCETTKLYRISALPLRHTVAPPLCQYLCMLYSPICICLSVCRFNSPLAVFAGGIENKRMPKNMQIAFRQSGLNGRKMVFRNAGVEPKNTSFHMHAQTQDSRCANNS